jgi:tetratricopeptide (TPR) repeat protein
VLFYELICGLSPYDLHHSSTAEIERAILDADPRVPSRRAIGPEQAGVRGLSVKALRALLAPELDAIALRAMAKPPADRYPSADAMRADLDRWLHGEPVLARPPAAWLTVRKFAARHRFGVAAGATAFVALLAVTGMALVQRQQAQREASRAVASRDFLLEMFRLADPDQSRGAALTAKDLLEAGRKKAFEGLADQPELQADLLTAIGGVQADIGEMTHADTTFGQAIELYGREGRTRGLALTEILRADNARRLLDYRTAAEFLKRAEVHAAELGEDQEVQARLSLTQGRIWGGTGQLESAAKAFQSSVERTARLWGENDERTILALAGLAEMQSRMPGHGQDAVATLDEAFRRADRNPNLHPGRRADLEIFRVYVALDSGRYRVAHEQATGAAQRCDREIGAGSELCQGLKRLQLTAALRTGRTKEASVLAIALMPTVTNTASPARQARALIQVTRALAASGQLAAHVGLRQQLIRFGRNEGEPGQQEPLRMSALLAQAEALLREERPREALDWVGEALRRYPPGQQDADLKARAEMFSALALQALGRHPEALDALAGAQAIYRQTLGPRHPDTLLCGLNRVRSLVALGRSAEARTLIEDSLPEMRDALGEASPVVLSIEKWRADLAAARSVDFHPARIRDFFS